MEEELELALCVKLEENSIDENPADEDNLDDDGGGGGDDDDEDGGGDDDCGEDYDDDDDDELIDSKKHRIDSDCGEMYLYGSRHDTCNVSQLLMTESDGFSAEKARELLMIAIVEHNLPLRLAECKVWQFLRPDLPTFSGKTIEDDALRMYAEYKPKVKKMLENACGRISLTCDPWTSMNGYGYVCLKAYFIDKDWVPQKKILNFCSLSPPYDEDFMVEEFSKLFAEWGIESKLFSLTMDIAPACVSMLTGQLNTIAVLLLNGEFFHLCCCVKVVNSIAQAGLAAIDHVVEKIRQSVIYVKWRKQQFLECVAHMSLDSKRGLRLDIPTRWNLTFLMLKCAAHYKCAFSHFAAIDSDYKQCPSEPEWEMVEKVCKLLAKCYDLTCIPLKAEYVTANLYFPALFSVYLTLKTESKSDDYFTRRLACGMMKTFEKYWSDYSSILAIAVVLDPRCKLEFVEFCYQKINGNSYEREVYQVHDKLFALFNEYTGGLKSTAASSLNQRSSQRDASKRPIFSEDSDDLFEEFENYSSHNLHPASKKTELELYLDEPRVPRTSTLDVLSYWKNNEYRYPKVAAMARDILAISMSTTALEYASDVGVLGKHRSGLKPQTMEALICLKDWLSGMKEDEDLHVDDNFDDIMKMDVPKGNSDE